MGEEVNMLPNNQVILRDYIQGCPKESDFQLRTTTISTRPPARSKGVLLKNLYLSCDPYMCHVMRSRGLSFIEHGSVHPGSVVKGPGVSKVIKSSDDDELKEGDYVVGFVQWEDFSWNVDPKRLLTKIETTYEVPLSYYAGILGLSGFSAYVGWTEICSAQPGETVYVSSAAGGVGHLAGQFAKMKGCYVVGSASTDEKVDMLKAKLGFDDAFNYKEGDLSSHLNKCFPKGIDIYFDNVGGEMLDEVLPRMKINGRIVICGMISQYNLDKPDGIHNMFRVIENRLSMRGFIVLDHMNMYPEYAKWAIKKLHEKELVNVEDVVPGIENAASALVGMFHGHNIGKRVVCVAEE